MKTYSLITKPYRIRLTEPKGHTLRHSIQDKFIHFGYGTEFWCSKCYSEDHKSKLSLIIFNHSFVTTFMTNSNTVKNKWEVIPTSLKWENDLQVLNVSFSNLNLLSDGTKPSFVK